MLARSSIHLPMAVSWVKERRKSLFWVPGSSLLPDTRTQGPRPVNRVHIVEPIFQQEAHVLVRGRNFWEVVFLADLHRLPCIRFLADM